MKYTNATAPGYCPDHCGDKNKKIKRQFCNISGIQAFEVYIPKCPVKQVKHSGKTCALFKQEYYLVSPYITFHYF